MNSVSFGFADQALCAANRSGRLPKNYARPVHRDPAIDFPSARISLKMLTLLSSPVCLESISLARRGDGELCFLNEIEADTGLL